MATRLYIAVGTYVFSSCACAAGWDSTSGVMRCAASTVRQGYSFTNRGPGAVVGNSCWVQMISEPLRAQTISGTIRGVARVLESAGAGCYAQMTIRVCDASGTIRGTLLALHTDALSSEYATTYTNRKFPLGWTGAGAALTPVACQNGDRLIIEVGHRSDVGGSTNYDTGSNSTADLAENETDTTQANHWFEFSQDLLWLTDAEPSRPVDGQRNAAEASYRQQTVGAPESLDYDMGASARVPALMSGSEATTSLPPAVTADTTPPTFAGISAVGAIGSTAIEVLWTAGTDNLTPPEGLTYLVHVSSIPNDSFQARAYSNPGATMVVVQDLVPDHTYYVRVLCRDEAGNLSTDTGVELAVVMPAEEATKPTLSNLSPAPDSAITPTQAVSFDVTDSILPGQAQGFRLVMVTASFAKTGITEVVHDGVGYTTMYSSQSTRSAISSGYHYQIQRAGGWPDGPQIKVYATDKAGNEASRIGGL